MKELTAVILVCLLAFALPAAAQDDFCDGTIVTSHSVRVLYLEKFSSWTVKAVHRRFAEVNEIYRANEVGVRFSVAEVARSPMLSTRELHEQGWYDGVSLVAHFSKDKRGAAFDRTIVVYREIDSLALARVLQAALRQTPISRGTTFCED